ncbi:MAG: permease [Candidatus Hodarchaeales archaeon]
MASILSIIQGALNSAFITLIDYLSLHVLLCLIPAFFIAGAMTIFIPKEIIMKYMGKDADPKIAYPTATLAGFLLAVCSCTVLPLFVGIWKKGVGLGPAITFLFVAPAVNILALTYTGILIGLDIALARAILAIIFAILIGVIMSKVFGDNSKQNTAFKEEKFLSNKKNDSLSISSVPTSTIVLISIFGLVSIFLAILDTYMINLIHDSFSASITFLNIFTETPWILQTIIFLLGLSILLSLTYKLESKELVLFFWLVYILMTGTSQISYFETEIDFLGLIIDPTISNMFGKLLLSIIVTIGLLLFIWRNIEKEKIDDWISETWFFTKSIFPLVLVGVIIAGFIKFFIDPQFVASLVGQNTVLANLIGVLFGVFMYFPTLLEVPIARIFLDAGMAKGPLLAYLLADPELSIQSILVTRKFLGDKRNLFYVGLVTLFTTIAGLLFGLILGQGISLW